VAVVGAGRMGRGIAHSFAYGGYDVTLIDLKARSEQETAQAREDAQGELARTIGLMQAFGLIDAAQQERILARISYVARAQAEAALSQAGVVFEGVPEKVELKEEALKFIGDHVRDECLIASTTSTIDVNTLAGFSKLPERFLNAHWLNPAFLIPLVEVSPSEITTEQSTRRLEQILESVGKVPVVCAASPGYIVPRIQALAMNEAARLVEEGVASAEDVDKAIRVGFGVRYAVLGLVEFIDWGGGDILYYASRYLTGALGNERYASPEVVTKKMEAGDIGVKTGKGFYDFTDVDVEAYQRETLQKFVDLLKHLKLLPPPAG